MDVREQTALRLQVLPGFPVYYKAICNQMICTSIAVCCPSFQITQMTRLIKDEFIKTVDTLPWMSDDTKVNAIEKVRWLVSEVYNYNIIFFSRAIGLNTSHDTAKTGEYPVL